MLSVLATAFTFFALLSGPALAAKDVTLTTADGVKIRASVDIAQASSKGAVLVHMLNRQGSDWSYFSKKLSGAGFSTVVPDLRGHGANATDDQELTTDDYKGMVNDVAAAVAWLRKQGIKDISCVGASIGANLCLQAAAADSGVVNVVLLSPGLNFKGVTTGDAIKAYGNRPLLLVASSEDQYSARSAGLLVDAAQGQKHLELLEGAGHGTKMLNRDPGLEGLVQSWLLGTFQLASGEMVRPAPRMGDTVGTVETEGQKLNSQK